MFFEKLRVEKLCYMVKFQEAAQSSNVVFSKCLFLKVEVKQRHGWIIYSVRFKFQCKKYSKKIFKTLFRETHRDQTILSFEQNLIEDK